ncbi:MAG: glycosyltransferase family 2 protein [Dehalococcoidia bacterium]|nr:glycosyltransferase family 2 protein [Dehalococcoidia bacterium]
MPRTFSSYMKDRTVSYKPARVTAVVCVFIPNFAGYYLERFRILKVCLASLRANAGEPLDLMVIDNASHPKVKTYLEELVAQGAIQHLISNAQNLGRGGALNLAFGAVQSEYIAYSDDDILFFPNWLVDELQVHEHFPNVGIVGGQPLPDSTGYRSAQEAVARYGLRSQPYQLSLEQIRIWAKSTGYTLDEYLQRDVVKERLSKLLLLESDGVQAVTGCAGYQGLLRRDLVDKIPGWPDGIAVDSKGRDPEWTKNMANLGFLVLNTTRRVTHHLGNRIDAEDQGLVKACGLDIHGAPAWRKALDPKEWELQLRRAPGFEVVKPVARVLLRRK